MYNAAGNAVSDLVTEHRQEGNWMAIRGNLSGLLRKSLWLTVMWIACQRASFAQVARYEPSSPTVSPYLNLTATNFGVVPNYYAFVRPEIRQREFNRQGRLLLSRQEQEISTLQDEIQRGTTPAAVTGTGSWFLVPARQTRFLDTTRFYPQPVINQIRR